jgi:hypothetical protein
MTGIYGVFAVPLKNAFDNADRNSYCCFSLDTEVLMDNGEYLSMVSVEPGDVLYDKTVVLGKLIVHSKAKDWYLYGDHTFVSGGHRVFEDGALVAVERSKRGIFIGHKHFSRMCLVTDKNTIWTRDGLFLDFQEYSDSKNLRKRAACALRELNNLRYVNPAIFNDRMETGERGVGLYPLQRVMTSTGLRPIGEISIHDKLGDEEEDNEVLGIYIVTLKNQRGIYIHDNWVSVSQIVHVDNEWIKAYMAKEPLYETFSGSFGVHLITSRGYFTLEGGLQIRDLAETRQLI